MPIRLHDKDINTPEFYNKMWAQIDLTIYDSVRLDYLLSSVKPKWSICELGAGVNGFVQYALDVRKLDVKATILDYSQIALDMAKTVAPALIAVRGNALATPFKDEEFDLVGAGELIEHIGSPKLLVNEMARICKPGGCLVISSVNPDCEDAKDMEYPEHLWKFTPSELMDYFMPHGAVLYQEVGNYHTIKCRKN